ncbi:MAG: homogentisate 1,2-dioxygenase [Pseudonocardiaceae bacterium]
MAYYRRVGEIPPKRHTQHRTPEGGLFYEELMGQEGFSSDSSLLYHRHLPSAIADATEWEPPPGGTVANHPLKPRHLRLHALFPDSDWKAQDVVTGRRLVLGNADVRISYVAAGEASPLYRDAIGDECVYIESGQAVVETVFGALDARDGDYVILPRGTTHRWVPHGAHPLRAYCIEASSHITPPRRYLSRFGQLLEHSPYCERDLRGPQAPLLAEDTGVQVLVKHRASRGATSGSSSGIVGTRYVYPHHPFDVVGWDGCLYPFTFNIADFEPITGRVHQPPPVHQVFEGTGFVICNFVPRKVDYHPLSIPVPYYHSNVDSDEVMFYCGGDYEARKGSGIAAGSISLHPGGHSHGPQPGATERSVGVEFFDELAVMVDTFRSLEIGEAGLTCEDPGYAWTWAGRAPGS